MNETVLVILLGVMFVAAIACMTMWRNITAIMPGMLYYKKTGKLLPWHRWAAVHDMYPFTIRVESLHTFRFSARYAIAFSDVLQIMRASYVVAEIERRNDPEEFRRDMDFMCGTFWLDR